ncbi:MAG: hypothetical protein KDN18_01265 [Verrucomicrobiae bacterium]|nr:hypothetical protein [Verrucomicrobiae bacterium]
MRSLLSTLVVYGIVALPAVLPAQEKSSVLSPAELASRRESVSNLESHIAGREKRMGEIVTDIRALDDRIEDGVNEIVLMLGGMKDSETSKVKIANTKADVIVGLKRTIDYYKKHRDLLREQLRTGKSALPRETLEKDLAIFDGRIEKRVQQIMELAKSFPDPQELEKYEVTSTSSWFGWSNENVEISEAWKQNRRDERHTEDAREGVSKGLRDSIENLQKRNAYLSEKIKSPNTSETERAYYETEIGQNAVLLEERNRQLEEFSSGDATTAFAVDQGKAHDVDQLVRSEREDLREDFFSLFRKYDELNRARGELKQLQDNLAARKEWLSKYDAEQAK